MSAPSDVVVIGAGIGGRADDAGEIGRAHV